MERSFQVDFEDRKSKDVFRPTAYFVPTGRAELEGIVNAVGSRGGGRMNKMSPTNSRRNASVCRRPAYEAGSRSSMRIAAGKIRRAERLVEDIICAGAHGVNPGGVMIGIVGYLTHALSRKGRRLLTG